MKLTKRQTARAFDLLMHAKNTMLSSTTRFIRAPGVDYGVCFYLGEAWNKLGEDGCATYNGYYTDLEIAHWYLRGWIAQMLDRKAYLQEWLRVTHDISDDGSEDYAWRLFNARIAWIDYMIKEIINEEK